MRKYNYQTRTKAIDHWQETGSVQKTATALGVHPKTIRRWIRWYKQGGVDNLNREWSVRRHPRRLDSILETRLVALKEARPEVTLAKAKELLIKEGIPVSEKGIWNVWKRHGMTGFQKDRFSTSYREYLFASHRSIKQNISKVKALVRDNQFEEAASAANRLPIFPFPDVLKDIPEKLLSRNRRLDRLSGAFGTLPLSQYHKKAHMLRKGFEVEGKQYSALRAGIEEGYALIWLGEPKALQNLSQKLKKKAHHLRDPGLQFALLLFEAHALGSFLDIKGALRCINKCKIIIRSLSNPYFFMGELAGLYSVLGFYREAMEWTVRALKGAQDPYRTHLKASLAGFYATAGEYGLAFKILREDHPEGWDYHSRGMLIKGFALLDRGEFQEATSTALQALNESKKEEIKRYLHLATFIIACGHAAAGDTHEAKRLLKKYHQLLKKHRLEKELFLRKLLLGNTLLPEKALRVPNLRLAVLFQKATATGYANDYRKALLYAQSKHLFGLFERIALFFPEPVKQLSMKRKKTGLPRSFIKMPAFQLDPPVYRLRFLGRTQLFKGRRQLRRLHLSPKETAFLISLATRKNRKIPLDDLYRNFWPQSSTPVRNLSHLLVRIRNILSLPSHLLGIREEHLFWDCYFTSDYELYEEGIAQAKALLRAGEWGFAKREYLRTFSLFRGEPFRKMYDDWSDDKRLEVLFSYETEVLAFAKELLKRKRKEEAKSLLKKAQNIIPDSDEIETLLGELAHKQHFL